MNTKFPCWIWAAVACLVMSGTWLSNESVAGPVVFGSGANQFVMDFVTIGNAGNTADTTGSPNPAGAVAYEYKIGKFEVSEDMITKFNGSQALLITTFGLSANKPTTGVSWNEAARFVNWLNTSTGGFAAYNFTSGGVNDNITPWTTADTLDYDASNPYRSIRTDYVLPSVDEWYKAAYFDPINTAYFLYPTGSNTAPTAVPNGTAAGTAVYDQTFLQGPADIMSAGGLSPYGIMGLGGNAAEWQESANLLANTNGSSDRVIRGGFWNNGFTDMESDESLFNAPGDSIPFVGFRVVSLGAKVQSVVPEPSSWVLALMGISALVYRRRMKKS